MAGHHFRNECKHGVVVTQCRCPDPNKTVNIVDCPPSCANAGGEEVSKPKRDEFFVLERCPWMPSPLLFGALYEDGMGDSIRPVTLVEAKVILSELGDGEDDMEDTVYTIATLATPTDAGLREASEMQTILKTDDGMIRFRQNKIVNFLLDAGPFDMNALAMMEFSAEDRMQFAQLIGYSISGYSELSYVSDESYEIAEAARAALSGREGSVPTSYQCGCDVVLGEADMEDLTQPYMPTCPLHGSALPQGGGE